MNSLEPNPPAGKWVTEVIARNYKLLEGAVRPAWLPTLANVRVLTKSTVVAEFREYGCGTFGCVYPTLDQNVVMKVTTDDTEAEFAAYLYPTMTEDVTVAYHQTVRTNDQHNGNPIYLLWREAAENVGMIVKYVEETSGSGAAARDVIHRQWLSAQDVVKAIYSGAPANEIGALAAGWAIQLEEMATQTAVPELHALAERMLKTYRSQAIFFGDVHEGNIGYVTRNGLGSWVVTDPGHIAVIKA
jgi:hypothetical protein